jgi:hypothetical protein
MRIRSQERFAIKPAFLKKMLETVQPASGKIESTAIKQECLTMIQRKLDSGTYSILSAKVITFSNP